MKKNKKTPASPARSKKVNISSPVDFSQIKTNNYAKQVLTNLSKKSLREIRIVVKVHTQKICDSGIKMGLKILEMKANRKNADKGYLNTPRKITSFWKEVERNTIAEAMDWVKNYKKSLSLKKVV